MTLDALRFASVILTAVAMAGGVAHLLELPSKIGLSRDDYRTVQQIYGGWALLGIAVVGALVSTAALALQVRRTPVEYYLTAAAAAFRATPLPGVALQLAGLHAPGCALGRILVRSALSSRPRIGVPAAELGGQAVNPSDPTRMKTIARLAMVTLGFAACSAEMPGNQSDGWLPLFDGQTLAGWRASENPATFRVENGAIVVHGPRAHLFYDGPVLNHAFRDFELRAEVMTRPGANSGIYIRTAFQPADWPSQGYEVQVNNSHTDWRRTGSLYAVQDVREAERDDEWFTVRVIVRGRRVRVMVDDRQTVDYTEPAGSATRLTGGTIALQGHDPGSEVHYRNIFVRPLRP